MNPHSNHPTNQPSLLLDVLTREGVLINVSVRYPRFHKKLKAADLGLGEEQVSDRLMSLGHKRLLPKEALAELALIESRTHALVDQCTFPFLGGIGHFLPNGKLIEAQERLSSQEQSFHQARSHFLEEYRTLRAEALEEWQAAAETIVQGRGEQERFLAQIQASFPTRASIEKKFSFEVHLFQVAVPESLGMELVSFADQNDIRRARHEAAQSAATQIQEGVETFVGECVTVLRQQTAQLCDEMLSAMHSGKTDGVHQRTLNRLVKFIDGFKQMNFANDQQMEQQLDQVRKRLLDRTAEDYRGNPIATRSLEKGLTDLRNHAADLASQSAHEMVERFGQLGRRKLQLAG
tara:strand:- start:6305 stop:7351 length:1047 start_codon:yes stop_codon:yes gene_type:complete